MKMLAEVVAVHAERLREIIAARAVVSEYTPFMREFTAFVRGLGDIEAELVEGLRRLRSEGDGRQRLLWLSAACHLPTPALVEPLCDLLDVRDEYLQHEWIADTLGDLADPRAVPALLRACSADFSGDIGRELAKKCLDALAAIETPEARAAIDAQRRGGWPEAREYLAEFFDDEGR